MENHIRLLPPEIGQHGVQGREVAVNVSDDGGTHGIQRVCDGELRVKRLSPDSGKKL
jgi:hypothetical protein